MTENLHNHRKLSWVHPVLVMLFVGLGLTGCGDDDDTSTAVEDSEVTTSTTLVEETSTETTEATPGPAGPPGPPGPAGPPGMSGYEIVEASESAVMQAQLGSLDASVACPAGKRVVGGGGAIELSGGQDSLVDAFLSRSEPAGDATWVVHAGWSYQTSGQPASMRLRVRAICASVA